MIELNASSAAREKFAETIGRLVMQWQDATEAYDEAVGERLNLNAAERRCLGFLHDGPKPAGAIAGATGLTPAAVTALVDRLEARGLVKRARSDEDRRKVMVETTPETYEITGTYYAPLAEEGARVLATFDAAELAAVERFLSAALDIQQRHLDAIRRDTPGRR